MIVATFIALLAAAGSTLCAPTASVVTAAAGRALISTLGDSATAGLYIDEAGSFVIPVTSDEAAAAVTEAGFVAKKVQHSMAKLNSIKATLDFTANKFVGSAWYVDPVSNRVVISVDSTLAESPENLQVLKSMATVAGGDAIDFDFINGTMWTSAGALTGGSAIYIRTEGIIASCSLGLNVRSGSKYYFLTAGHCGKVGEVFHTTRDLAAASRLGVVVRSSFPGNDYAVVAYDARTTGLPGVGNVGAQDITSLGRAVVGQSITRTGFRSGTRTGRVTGLGVTANYFQGSVTGLIMSDVCSNRGDSGGPLYSGSVGLGVTSGGTGGCGRGFGRTYFQPAIPAANAIGAVVY